MTTEKLTAFLVGATGEVGKALIEELAKNKQFARVTLLTRRNIELPPKTGAGAENRTAPAATAADINNEADYKKFDQKIIDFDKLETDYASDFEGYQVGFCSLGTTTSKGTDVFIKVDHDYVVSCAKLAKAGGLEHFNLVSAASANKNSMLLYPRVKGEAEEGVSALGFQRLSIWRPGLLISDRTHEPRFGENVAKFFARRFDKSGGWSVHVPLLAKVIVSHCFQPVKTTAVNADATNANPGIEILDNRDIMQLSAGLSSSES